MNKKKFLSKNNNNITIDPSNKTRNKFSLTTNEFSKTNNKKQKSKKNKSKGNADDDYKNIKNINSQKIKTKFISPMKTMTASMNQKWHNKYSDKRIQKCLNQFNEKLFELQKPFELLYNNRNIKRNILPRINQNIFNSYNMTK